MQVYLVVLILHPTKKQVYDDGAVPMVIGGDSHVILADTDTQAAAKAMKFLPDEYKDKEDRVEVALVPFRSAASR
jgi:hypothetical protein